MVKETGPTFVQKPILDQSDDGRVLKFSCRIAGEPRPDFKWFLNDRGLKDGGRYFMTTKADKDDYIVALEIEDVSGEDAGNYKIVAENKSGSTSATINLKFGEEEGEAGEKGDGLAPNFTMKPKMRQSDDGIKLTIECELMADPEPEITWYRGSSILKDGGRYKLTCTPDGEYFFMMLEITDVTEKDGGEYKIVATNKLGTATNTIKLNFQTGAPSFTLQPKIEQSPDGRHLTFQCELTADPEPTLTWFKDDVPLSAGGRYKMTVDKDENFYFLSLEIAEVSGKDAGKYKIMAKNEHGDAKSTIDLNFEGGTEEPPPPKPPVQGTAPSFVGKPSMRQSEDGQSVFFDCRLKADPEPEIIWLYGNKRIPTGGRYNVSLSPKGDTYALQLSMSNVTPKDGGTYIVFARNKAGEDKTTINLNFDVREANKEGAPTFIEKPTIKQEDGGRRLVMECKVMADPKPKVSWSYNGRELKDSGRYRIRTSKMGKIYVLVLDMTSVTNQDFGNYNVVVENEKGKASSMINVKFEAKDKRFPRKFEVATQIAGVHVDFGTAATEIIDLGLDFGTLELLMPEMAPSGPMEIELSSSGPEIAEKPAVIKDAAPSIAEPLKDQDVEDGKSVEFRCKIIGKATKVIWYRDGKEVRPSPVIKMSQEGDVYFLRISKTVVGHSGDYSITVVGPGGEAKSEAELYVDDYASQPPAAPKDEPPKRPAAEQQEDVPSKTMKIEPVDEPVVMEIEEKDKPAKKTAPKKDEEAPPSKKPKPNVDTPQEASPVEEAITPMDQTPAESAPVPMEIEISPEGGIVAQQMPDTQSAIPKQRRMSATDYLDEEIVPESQPSTQESAPIAQAPIDNDTGFKRSGQAVKPPQTKTAIPPPAVKMKGKGGAPSFIESPDEVQVVEGQSVKFEAVVEGNPKPVVTWSKGNNDITDGFNSRYATKCHDQRNVHILEIKKAELGDSGKFGCKVENENGNDMRAFSLLVTSKPATEELDFRAMLRHRVVHRQESKVEVPDWGSLKDTDVPEKVGAEITRPLKTTRVNERDGRLKLEVGVKVVGIKPTWYKDDKELTASKKFKIKNTTPNDYEITIMDLKKEDSGTYMVKFGDFAESKTEVIVDGGKPKVDYVTQLKPVDVHEGQDAKFTCELTGDCMDLAWYKNNEKVPPRDKKCEIKRLGRRHTLIVKDCKPADQGEVAISIFGLFSRAELTVKSKPKFIKDLEPVTVVESRSCSLQCEISDSSSEVQWLKAGKPVVLDDRVATKMDKGVRMLVFYKAAFDDAAEYTVKFAALESKANLTVTDPPDFTGNLAEETECFVHQDAEFATEVSGEEAEAFWFKNGKMIEPDDDKYEVIADGNIRKLIVKDVAPEDEASYACALDETRTTRSNLQVHAPPTISIPVNMTDITVKAGEPAEVTIDLSGSPAPEVEWTKSGVAIMPDNRTQAVTMPDSAILLVTHAERSDTSDYTVTVTNKHGAETATFKITVIDKPQSPENVKIVSYDEHSISLAWKPPSDTGNTDITQYTVEYKEVKRGEWTMADDTVQSTEFTVGDLTEGKEYYLRVAAVNVVGISEPVQTDRSQLCKEPFDPADQMEPPAVVDTHDGSIELQWAPPEFDGGCPITGYIIEKREAGSPRWSKATKEPLKGTRYEVPDLAQGAEYEFRAIAINKAGQSEPSAPSKAAQAREPIDPTLPPGEPVIEDVTKDSVALSWTKPADDGGSPIAGYYVEKKTPQTGEWQRVNKKPTRDTQFTVPNLTEGEEYEFRVLAENEAGLSEPSKVSPPVIAKDPEIPPTLDVAQLKDIIVKAGQSIKLALSFTGSPPPTVSWSLDDESLTPDDRTKVRSSPTTSELTTMDSRRSDTGVYAVTVTNPFGKEKATANVNVLDKPSPPKGPMEVSDVTAVSAVFSWLPPADDGGQPITNYVIEKRDTRRSGWSVVNDTVKDTSVKVTKLQEGTEYMFRVSAESSFGISKPLETPHTVLAKNPYDEPGSPGVPEITDYDYDYVELAWSPPDEDGGADIEGYVIEKKDKTSSRWIEATDKPVQGNEFKVPNLAEGRTYEFRVSAINKAGRGKPSQVSQPKLVKAKFSKPILRIDCLKDLKIRAGQELKLNVPFDGSPLPTVSWKKNGSELQPSEHVQVTNSDELTVVHAVESQRDDTGEYELTLSNDSGTLTAKCFVNVLDKPSPPEPPFDITDITNETCKLSWNPPKDDGGSEISIYVVEKREADDDYWSKCGGFIQSPSFTVTKLSRGKEYVFRVMAENLHGGVSAPLESAVIIAKNPYDEPDAPGKPKIVSYDRDRAELTWAEPQSDGGDTVTGYTVERKEPKSGRWSRVNKAPILGTKFTVPGLIEGREYHFRVVAENRAGPSRPSEESDIMTAKPEFERPTIDTNAVNLRDIKVKAGQPFDIKIPFTASPAPDSLWYKDNREVKLSTRTQVETTETVALFHNEAAERGDSGTYKVTLENDSGTDSASLNVTVLCCPTAPKGPLEYSDFKTDSVRLSWQPPEDDGHGAITGYVVEQRDAGRDSWAKVTSSASASGYVAKNLINHNDYVFRVSAVNQYGVSEPLEGRQMKAKLPFDEPDSTGTPVVEAVDRTSATLSWTPPDNDGGSPVTGYAIEYRQPDSRNWEPASVYPTKDTQFTVPNLTEGNEYQFRVIALNEAGPGKPSRASEAVVAKAPILPADAPGRPTVDKVMKEKIGISWTKPLSDGGSKITDYVIEKRKIPEHGQRPEWEEAVKVPACEDHATVPDLEEGEQYEFRVRAKTEAGPPGKPSTATPGVTAEDRPECPVLDISNLKDVKVKGGEPFELKLAYTGMPKPDITWELNGQPVKEDGRIIIKTTGEFTAVIVESAQRRDSGRYTVTLHNSAGTDSAKVKVVVLDAPDMPEGPLKVSNITPDSASLSWQPPKVGAEDVENYIVEKRDGDTGAWTKISSFCAVPNLKVRNLAEGTEYQFRVSAENKYGGSRPLVSEPIVAKHPFDAPGAPEAPRATKTDRTAITIAWKPPLNDGGNPVTGYIVEKREAGASKWVPATRSQVRDTSCTVPKLVEGNEYEFRVIAQNEAGPGKPSEISEGILAAPPAVKPKVRSDRSKEVTVVAGEPFRFEISFESTPTPRVTMTADDDGGREVSFGNHYDIQEEPDSVIISCRRSERTDSGRYTVTLRNSEGADTCNVRVTVVDKPGPPEGPLEVSDVTAESVKLSWKPPKDDGGNRITNYVVEKKEEGMSNWAKVSSFVRTPDYNVSGLDEDVKYLFRVSAENQYGVGEPLVNSNTVHVKSPYSISDAPGKPTIHEVERGYVKMSWEAPEYDGGAKITGYIVEKREEDMEWVQCNSFLVKDTTMSLSNLRETAEYEFRVIAKNVAGLSAPSRPSNGVVPKPQYTTSDQPGVPEVENVTSNSVDLTWEKPPSDGGSPITGYTVEKREAGGGPWTKANRYPIKDSNFTLDGLEEGKVYDVRVFADNAAGTSQPSYSVAPIKSKDSVKGKGPFFDRRLENITGSQGDSAKFECAVSGTPQPTITWYKNGVEMYTSGRITSRQSDDICTLTFNDLKDSDSGDYTCQASNKLGTEKCKAKLAVQLAPQVGNVPRDLTVEVGNSFKVKIPFVGKGDVSARCLRDGQPVNDDRVRLTVFDDYVIMNVKRAEPEDNATFRVTIGNDAGSDTANFTVKVLDVPGPPRGPLEVGEVTNTSVHISWKPPAHNGGVPIKSYCVERCEEGSRDWITVGSFVQEPSFNVQGLQTGLPYEFRVAAENDIGVGKPLLGDSAIVAKSPYDAPDRPGEPEVTQIGKDFVGLAWTRPHSDGGSPITGYMIEKTEARSERWVHINRSPIMALSFAVPNLIEDREYDFRVSAINQAGLVSEPAVGSNSVLVKDPNEVIRPRFEEGLKDTVAQEGRTARFECFFSGKPPPEVKWMKGTRELFPNNKYQIETDTNLSTLSINDVRPDDGEEYTCQIKNPGGKKVSRAQLSVKFAPKIKLPARFRDAEVAFLKGEPIKLKIPVSGFPRPESSWAVNGRDISRGVEATERHTTLTVASAQRKDSGQYEVIAENEVGSDSAVIYVCVNDVPGSPTNLRADDVTHESVELTWTAPSDDGGSRIDAYVIEKRAAASDAWSRAGYTPGQTSHVVSLLEPGKEYRFRVRAENVTGASEPAEVTHTDTIPEPEKPIRRMVAESQESALPPERPKLPRVHDYDTIVEEGFTPKKVKLRKTSPESRYEFGEELGRGEYGIVRRALERQTGRNYAAKFVGDGGADKIHIKQEMDTMSALQHPRLLQMHDAFEVDDQMIMILDFLSGGDPFDRIRDRDHLTEEEVACLTRQVCDGLNYLHLRNYIHLDLKPQSILYETKKSNNIRIIDLGMATKLDPDERVKVVSGSSEYSSPELISGSPVGFSTDMWTVGVIVYMLLSGVHPFDHDEDKIKRGRFTFDQAVFRGISEEAKDFISQLLVLDTEKRMAAYEALEHPWLKNTSQWSKNRIPTDRHKLLLERPGWMPGTHFLAIGRLSNTSAHRRRRPLSGDFVIEVGMSRREARPRFVRRPIDTFAMEDREALFKCVIATPSQPVVTWWKDDKELKQSVKYKSQYDDVNYSLVVSRCQIEEAGNYTVKAVNSYGELTQESHLTVEPDPMKHRAQSKKRRLEQAAPPPRPDSKPAFTFRLRPRTIQEGAIVRLSCIASGYPEPKVTWMRNGEVIPKTHPDFKQEYSYRLAVLEIDRVSPSTSGRISCIAENSMGTDETECIISVEDRSHKSSSSQSVSTSSRRSHRLDEDDTTSAARTIQQGFREYRQKKESVSEEISESTEGGEHSRREMRRERREEVNVTESTSHGQRTSSIHAAAAAEEEMDIDLEDPETEKAALKIQAGFKGMMVRKKGGAAEEDADKARDITEEGDTDDKEEGEGVVVTEETGEVEVDDIQKGVAEVEAAPGVEDVEETTPDVLVPEGYKGPVMVTKPETMSVDEGMSAMFRCKLLEAAEEVYWLQDGRELEDGGRFALISEGSEYGLQIPMALSTDTATYTLKVKNAFGECETTFSLQVVHEDAEPVNIEELLKSVE